MYARVRYEGIYPGVDLVFHGSQGFLEYDLVVAPVADPGAITLTFKGADSLAVDAHGELVLQVGEREIRQHKPVAYQERDGLRTEIAVNFVIKGPREVAFDVGPYERALPLVIDPVVVYSTHLGGRKDINDQEFGHSIVVDADGHAYVSGGTPSPTFPTTRKAAQARFGGRSDAFVAKLNPEGSALLFATYLGGRDFESGRGIAIDASGNVYVTGDTSSANFPVKAREVKSKCGRGPDVFTAKISPDGSRLLYANCLGGGNIDRGNSIAVDAEGNAYVTGETMSPDFPTTQNAVQSAHGGGDYFDAFVLKVNPSGSALVYSTYIGGHLPDIGTDITVDSAGHAYVTGGTRSANFPVTLKPAQSRHRGSGKDFDAFVARLNPQGSAFVYSTYLGGAGSDGGRGIAVDADGDAYITGETSSNNFPTTSKAFQRELRGNTDAYVAKLSSDGSALLYSTYLGAQGSVEGRDIAVDARRQVYITGTTRSTNFPTTIQTLQREPGGLTEVFVAKLNEDGSALLFSTLFGGRGQDRGLGIALDPAGSAYITGVTSSPDFPTTVGALESEFGSGLEGAFVVKLDPKTASN
jgi:hypothetical protein